ncbi:MAG: DUF308 domain-containing protein [Lachnospiraceae bacterium]|nr:DUF308 domain-containing protein [Lachnospiraceae bacterium]
MTIRQRFQQVFVGVLMLAFGAVMIAYDEESYPFIIALYSLALELQGFRLIWYFFTMARLMVGGKSILYRGILFIDFGVFTGSLVFVPQIYILIYLSGTLALSAMIDLLRSREARAIHSPWKLKTFQGAVELITAVICLVFLHSTAMVVDIFSAVFIFSGVMRIVSAFRRMPVITVS